MYAQMVFMVTYDRSQVNEMIRKMQGERSIRAFAKKLKLSAAYLSDVLRGNREPSKRILILFRLRKIKETTVRYVRDGGRQS